MSEDLKKSSKKNPNTGSGVIAGGNIKSLLKMNKTAVVILNWNGLDLSENVPWNGY